MASIDERWEIVAGLLGRGRYTEIAERSGYCRQHVSGMLTGRRNFTTKSLSKIAKAAGVTEEELLAYYLNVRKINGSRSTLDQLAEGTGQHPGAS